MRSTSSLSRTRSRFILPVLCACFSPLFLDPLLVFADTELADPSGTGWRLEQIQLMNDTVTAPEEGGRYHLLFGIDGNIAIEAGCIRATGQISTFNPPQLQFSQIDTAPERCSPGSLSEQYLRDLGSVRSFVYRDGHLYLSTLADGSILDFAPLPAKEAVVRLGALSLVTQDVDALRSIALARLMHAYGVTHGIAASKSEIDSLLEDMDKRLREDLGDDYVEEPVQSEEEQAEQDKVRSAMAASMIRNWKINAALHEQYGGRIIYQQLGPEPLDAYMALLQEAEKSGELAIADPEMQSKFWAFFQDEQRHSFIPVGSEEEAQAFSNPPWDPGR